MFEKEKKKKIKLKCRDEIEKWSLGKFNSVHIY